MEKMVGVGVIGTESEKKLYFFISPHSKSAFFSSKTRIFLVVLIRKLSKLPQNRVKVRVFLETLKSRSI